MTELSQAVLGHWQVRKSRRQKTVFLDFLQRHIPEAQVESSPIARNLVIGNVKTAKLVMTAHYDTCARLPFPNFITPKNFWLYLGYQLLILLPLLCVLYGLLWWLPQLNVDFWVSYWLALAVFIGLGVLLFAGPVANPHNANDNTSGVITLLEIWAALTPEQRQKVCLVFFDNEENGLLGSATFASRHKKDGMKDKLVLNFDCVSDGDHILFAANKTAMTRYGSAMQAAFPSNKAKSAEITRKAFYPSDQVNFPVGIGVAALKKKKGLGLYLDRIHTKKDTVFMEENIHFLTEGTIQFLETL